MVDEKKEFGMLSPRIPGGSPVTLHVTAPDADAAIAKAEKAAASVKIRAVDMFGDDRYGVLINPRGHNSSIAHPLANLPRGEDELRRAARQIMGKQPTDWARNGGDRPCRSTHKLTP
jgi:hypothetical protein